MGDPLTDRAHRSAGTRLRGRSRQLRTLVADVREEIRGHDLTLMTAGLTFYAAIAVVPLMLMAVWLASLLVGIDTVMNLSGALIDLAPTGLGLRAGLTALQSAGPTLGIASFVAGIIPATTYGEGLLRVFARFERNDVPRKALRGRVTSVVLLTLFPVLTVAGLFALAAATEVLGRSLIARLFGVYLAFVFGWLVSGVVVGVIYRAFGARRTSFRSLAWGAAATGSFLSGMTLGWLTVLKIGIDVGAAYGGSRFLGSAVLFVVYLYLVQFALLVGYATTLALARRAPG